nr:hypothetical protein [Micromonospora yangpuensis]
MRQQQHGQPRIGAGERRGVVGAVTGDAGRGGGHVVHPGDDEPGTVPLDHQVPVVQGLPAEGPHVVHPALRLAVVLVVARHVHPGQPGPDDTQRRCLRPALVDRTVSDVAGVADDVGSQAVDHLDRAGGPAGPVDRAVVGIGQQHHPNPVETGSQPADGDVYPPNPGHPHRLGVTPDSQDDRDDHRAGSHVPRPHRLGDPHRGQRKPGHITDQRPDEQDPHQPKQRVPRTGRRVQPPPAMPEKHQNGKRDQRDDEHARTGSHHRRRPPRRHRQRPPWQPEQQRQDPDQRHPEHQRPQQPPRRPHLYGIASSHRRPPVGSVQHDTNRTASTTPENRNGLGP